MTLALEIRSLPELTEPELIEARNLLLDEADGLIAAGKNEKRALTGKEENRFNAIQNEISDIDRQLQSKRLNIGSNPILKYSPQQQQEVRAFVDFVKTGETRDLSSGANGVIIPTTVSTSIISKIKELAPIYQRMQVYNVTGNLSVPSYDWSAHNVGWIQDLQEITASGGSFTTVDIPATNTMATLAMIGRNLLNRSDVPVLDIIVAQIATAMANFFNSEIISGTTFSGNLRSVTQTTTAASPTAIGVDDLLGLQMSVPSVLQNNAAWLMHPNVFLAVRRLKSTTGELLLVGDDVGLAADLGYQLLGKPVMLDESMPATLAAGVRSVYYGDFSALIANQNAVLSTQVLIERYADLNATGLVSCWDINTNLGQPRALAALVH